MFTWWHEEATLTRDILIPAWSYYCSIYLYCTRNGYQQLSSYSWMCSPQLWCLSAALSRLHPGTWQFSSLHFLGSARNYCYNYNIDHRWLILLLRLVSINISSSNLAYIYTKVEQTCRLCSFHGVVYSRYFVTLLRPHGFWQYIKNKHNP